VAGLILDVGFPANILGGAISIGPVPTTRVRIDAVDLNNTTRSRRRRRRRRRRQIIIIIVIIYYCCYCRHHPPQYFSLLKIVGRYNRSQFAK